MEKQNSGKTEKRDVGVLILHGFGGGRTEVESLARRLAEEGYRVSVPCLPGHEKTKKLRGASRRQWIAAAEEAYESLSNQCRKTYLVGFSMGGLLAVYTLAYRFPTCNRQDARLGGLVTVNTPVYYWNVRQMARNLLRDPSGSGGHWRRRYLESPGRFSLWSMVQFQLLLSGSKRLYRRIYCPALILQLADDDAVWPSSGDYILRHMKGRRALLKLPRGGHQVFQSLDRGEACDAICRFLSQ